MNDQNKAHSQIEESENKVVDTENTSDNSQTVQDPRDNITEDHPRFQKVYGDLKSTKEELKSEREAREKLELRIAELESQKTQNKESDDFSKEEDAALDKILLGLKKKAGIVTQEDLEKTRNAERRANTLTSLQKDYDGTNGLPRFETNEVIEHAQRNGFGDNYLAAFRDLHFSAFVKHEASRGSVQNVDSESPSGGNKELSTDLEKLRAGDQKLWNKKKGSIMQEFKRSIFNN